MIEQEFFFGDLAATIEHVKPITGSVLVFNFQDTTLSQAHMAAVRRHLYEASESHAKKTGVQFTFLAFFGAKVTIQQLAPGERPELALDDAGNLVPVV